MIVFFQRNMTNEIMDFPILDFKKKTLIVLAVK